MNLKTKENKRRLKKKTLGLESHNVLKKFLRLRNHKIQKITYDFEIINKIKIN